MKKTTKLNQSSVPVQHSHTADTAAAPAAQPATPAPVGQSGTDKPDNRERTGNLPPIDRDQRADLDAARRHQRGRSQATLELPGLGAESGANVVTTDNSDWATNCPEYKVTAVQVSAANGSAAARS